MLHGVTMRIRRFHFVLLIIWKQLFSTAFNHISKRATSVSFRLFSTRSPSFSVDPYTTSVILYHKPIDVVTTHASDDVLSRRNVFQDIAERTGQEIRGGASQGKGLLPPNFPKG